MQKFFPETIGGVMEDDDIEAGRYFIHREMQCTWWGWEEGSCFFLNMSSGIQLYDNIFSK